MTTKPLINKQFKNFLFLNIKPLVSNSQKVIIDFSSPNIAKPFHPGHLRATLLGNFVSNINELFGHNVIRINYLGDWGKQFGFLIHGLKIFKKDSQLEDMSEKDFFEVYVKSNKELINESDLFAIKEITTKLENGDKDLHEKWLKIKTFSVDNLQKVYKRLGIEFDSFEFESDYAHTCKDIIKRYQVDNKSFIYDDDALCYNVNGDNRVVLLTKEGSSLYITRDIAAAISRFEQYRPDRVHYVVDSGQNLHFTRLEKILFDFGYKYDYKSSDLIPKHFHINFGRVLGMSTRSGNVIFLQDILDNAKSLMLDKLTKAGVVTLTNDGNLDELAEFMGRTIIFCEFLRTPRNNSFKFLWDRDNLGFRLQYCRASLNSLERRCAENSIEPNLDGCFDIGNYEYFQAYSSASKLVTHILEFDKILLRCYLECESCYLVHYVSKMTGLINSAMRELNIINCPDKSEAECRLRLFSVSKFILDLSYRTLGLPVVNKI